MAYAVQPNTAQAKLTTDEVVHLRRERERTNATGFDILAHMKNPPKGLDAALINNACRGAKVFMPTGAYSALKTAYAALPDISKTHFKPSKRHFATILAEKRRTGAGAKGVMNNIKKPPEDLTLSIIETVVRASLAGWISKKHWTAILDGYATLPSAKVANRPNVSKNNSKPKKAKPT